MNLKNKKSCKVKEIKPDASYDWVVSAQSYLLSSKIMCDELVSSYNHLGKSFDGDDRENIFKKHGLSIHPNYELITPMIFNLRHGLELWLKSISIECFGECCFTHDLKHLYEHLFFKLIDKSKNQLREIESVVLKYCDFHFIAGFSPTVDRDNMIFRYPGNNKNDRLAKFKVVTLNLVNELRSDICLVNNLFRTILKSSHSNMSKI